MDIVSHARDLPYWTLKDMKQAISNCHDLFDKQQPAWDKLYMLKIMSYRELQRGYSGNDNV